MTNKQETINQIREFNRFYTVLFGFLNRNYLDSNYSVTETRILFELRPVSYTHLDVYKRQEVYGAAADRPQASIVFDVAKQMVEMSPALMKRSKLMAATKKIVNYGNAGYYQVLSAEVGVSMDFRYRVLCLMRSIRSRTGSYMTCLQKDHRMPDRILCISLSQQPERTAIR